MEVVGVWALILLILMGLMGLRVGGMDGFGQFDWDPGWESGGLLVPCLVFILDLGLTVLVECGSFD